MRLFHRILLFFVGVIVFQATLTILAITNVAGRSNRADARQELERMGAMHHPPRALNGFAGHVFSSLSTQATAWMTAFGFCTVIGSAAA